MTPANGLFDDSWNPPLNGSRIHVMVQNPTSVFVYWQVDALKQQLISAHFRTPWAELPLRLRIRDVSGVWYDGYNASSSLDVVVTSTDAKWYVHDVQPGRDYLAELGVLTWDQQFFAVLRSNTVQTPKIPSVDAVHPYVRFASIHRVGPFQVSFNPVSTGDDQLGQSEAPDSGDGQRYPFMREFDGYSVFEGGMHDGD